MTSVYVEGFHVEQRKVEEHSSLHDVKSVAATAGVCHFMVYGLSNTEVRVSVYFRCHWNVSQRRRSGLGAGRSWNKQLKRLRGG
jgi:hypothetical protein